MYSVLKKEDETVIVVVDSETLCLIFFSLITHFYKEILKSLYQVMIYTKGKENL